MGYKLGGNLSTALEKTDLLVAGDYGYNQIFHVVQPPKNRLKVSLFFTLNSAEKGKQEKIIYITYISNILMNTQTGIC